MPSHDSHPPTKYGIVLFPGFQALDVFGPVDILNMLSKRTPLELSIIAETLDPVSTKGEGPKTATIGQSVVPTHTFQNPPSDVEVLLVPGGGGTRNAERTKPIIEYLQQTYPKLRYLLTVCTGSALVARAGLLDGHEATSNKRSFSWVTAQGPKVNWIREARWVTSGNFWTSSGISAGIDMMFAFVASQYGEDVALEISIQSDYLEAHLRRMAGHPSAMNSHALVLGRHRQDGSSALSSPGSLAEHSSSGRENTAKPRRKPIPRKGHTKSRKGCLNCKRRKVKCQETLPGCSHCERLGLACEYPGDNDLALFPPKTSPSPERALQSTPTQFTMEDLRFFHHFLFHAYPPLPLRGNAVWQHVSALSHDFDFLIHAMLGLAASHLSMGSTADYTSEALSHRVSAIGSLNRALNRPCTSKAEGDARFATCMALAFQSSYMPGGMLEFLCMIRGCNVVSTSAMPSFNDSIFQTFSAEEHQQSLQVINQDIPMRGLGNEFLDAAQASIRALAPLCRGVMEVKYLAILDSLLKAAKFSELDAVIEAAAAYTIFGEASNTEFALFTDPLNFPAQLIMIHFFIIEYSVGLNPMKDIMNLIPFRRTIVKCWILELERKLPMKYKKYIRWPMEFVQSKNEDLSRVVELGG